MNNKYSVRQLINSMKKYSSNKIEHDVYIQNYIDDVIHDLQNIFNIDLSKKYLSLSSIKKMLNL